MDSKRNVVRLKVGLHVFAIGFVHDAIGDEEAATPFLVNVRQMGMLGFKDAVHKLEA